MHGGTALQRAGTFGHENGHNLGAAHDKSDPNEWPSYLASCAALGLRSTSKVCSSGAKVDLMCSANSECGGGGAKCNVPNDLHCVGGTNNGKRCFPSGGCPDGYCWGPQNFVCDGGEFAGKGCNFYHLATTCPFPNNCGQNSLSYNIYFMGASGLLAGFSPCSKLQIAHYLSTSGTQCLKPIPCGDVTLDEVVNVVDGHRALTLATLGLSAYDSLADVHPIGKPDGVVTATDALYLLQVAVGSALAPDVCGAPEVLPW